MSEDKKESNDILEESIASVKAAKKQHEEQQAAEEKKAELSQEDLLKLIKELKSEISDMKKTNEDNEPDDIDDDSSEDDDDDLDDEDDTDDEDEKDDDDNSENEKLKSEVEKLKKQLKEKRKDSESKKDVSGFAKVKNICNKAFKGCLILLGVWFLISLLITFAFWAIAPREIFDNQNKSSITQSKNPQEKPVSDTNTKAESESSDKNAAAIGDTVQYTNTTKEDADSPTNNNPTGKNAVNSPLSKNPQEKTVSDTNTKAENESTDKGAVATGDAVQSENKESDGISESGNKSKESVTKKTTKKATAKKSNKSTKKHVKIQPPKSEDESKGILMLYRNYKWYLFGACVFVFLCKILLRKENKWGLACRYAIFTGLLLWPILRQDCEANALIFFGFFTAFFIVPTLYWFFGEISKCPKCGTTYAFEEVKRDYDHALAPKYARDVNGKLAKDSLGNTYQVQTVYYRVTLRCKNCGYTKQVMRKVEEKI